MMTAFLLSWKEGILFAALVIFLCTPRGRGLRRYCLLGLFIYLLNQPLIANFHPGDIGWWLKEPAAWITVATWVGATAALVRWFKGIHGQGVWSALSAVSWQSHLLVLSFIIGAIFLFNLSAISPQFKTQADFSFVVVLINIPLQYFIGFSLLRSYDETVKSPLFRALAGVLLCVLLVSLIHLYGTIAEYRALLKIYPSKKKVVELIERWDALLERNRVASLGSIRVTAYGRIGDLKLSRGDVTGARQSYQRAIREDFDDVAASRGLTRLLIRERKTVKARRAFQRIIQRNPSRPWKELARGFPPLSFYEFFVLAEALEAEGKQDEAFEAYSQALHMRPRNPWVSFRLGRIYVAQGDYEKALAAFQKTLTKVPRHLQALSYLVDIYTETGKVDQAQRYRDIIMQEIVTHRILPSDWRGRSGGNLPCMGECRAWVTLYRGTVVFTIHARGIPQEGVWPHMVVRLNKQIIGEVDVMTTELKPYSFTADVETDAYRLEVYCTSDFSVETEDVSRKLSEGKHLFVEGVDITYVQ